MKRFWKDIKKNYKYVLYSARAELKAEVANSYLNWIWWILEPICFMIIYTLIFGYVFNAKENYFPVFIFIGITAWDFFSRNMKNSVLMVKKNKAIVSKVYLPKFVLILSKMYVNGFKMIISCLIIAGMMLIYRIPITWNIIYVIPLMVLLFLISFSFMSILLHLGVYIDDLSNVINILLKFMFYMTGIFYSIETRLGGKYPKIAHLMAQYNPMAYIIIGFRKALIYGERPSLKAMLAWYVIAMLIAVIGIRTIYKNENSYVKVI